VRKSLKGLPERRSGMGEGDDRLIGMSTAENLHTGCAVLGIKAA